MILAGAVPAALLALTFDGGLMLLERGIRRAIESGGCASRADDRDRRRAGDGRGRGRRGGRHAAGRRRDPRRLEELHRADRARRAAGADASSVRPDLKVERRLNLGGTFICDQAMRSGDIDVYVEYRAPRCTAVFHQPVETDPSRVLDAIRQRYARGRAHAARTARLREHVRDPRPRPGCARRSTCRPSAMPQAGAPTGGPALATSSCSVLTATRVWPKLTACNSRAPPRAMDLSLIYRALADAAGRSDRRRRDERPDRCVRPDDAEGRSAVFSAVRRRAGGAERDAAGASAGRRTRSRRWPGKSPWPTCAG